MPNLTRQIPWLRVFVEGVVIVELAASHQSHPAIAPPDKTSAPGRENYDEHANPTDAARHIRTPYGGANGMSELATDNCQSAAIDP